MEGVGGLKEFSVGKISGPSLFRGGRARELLGLKSGLTKFRGLN